eukprot:TRINITY_DN17705_c0_g1_i1.p1 TRINITY_DN17705_c0_g1~~TRINITY_DN17705_c0_g1_i1.p1  ORF type:complete len:169 (+),score=1.74 TRINITY_DN17705_c0_g1_i1:228-734(+)
MSTHSAGVEHEKFENIAATITNQFNTLYAPYKVSTVLPAEIPVRKISEKMAEGIAAPFSEQETKVALAKMTTLSAPGPDMLIAKFYQVHSKVLIPVLTQVFNSTYQTPVQSPEFVVSYTTLVPKKCASISGFDMIRPISLCNTDYNYCSRCWQQELCLPSLSSYPLSR